MSTCLGGDTYVAGLRKDEEALRALCERKGKKVAVLWPGEGAVSIGDLGVSVHSGDGDREPKPKPKPKPKEKETEEGYTFVAIDGTWKNARNMLKRLPRDKVTLVSLPPEAFIGESVGGIHTKPPAVASRSGAKVSGRSGWTDQHVRGVRRAVACAGCGRGFVRGAAGEREDEGGRGEGSEVHGAGVREGDG